MSRRIKWIVAASALVIVGLVSGLQWHAEWRARYWESQWREFRAHWEAKGEVFAQEPLESQAVADRENFMKHPWFPQHRDRKDELSARMQPDAIAGYDEWNHEEVMPEPLARRVRAHYEACAGDFTALREATQRTRCRLVFRITAENPAPPWELGLLQPCYHALEAKAAAEIAVGEEAAGVNDLVLMLKIGSHLRNSGSLLGTVIGAGFESAAYHMIRKPWFSGLTADHRAQLLAALDLRDISIGEELAVILRRERNQLLGVIDEIAAGKSHPTKLPNFPLTSLRQITRVVLARNRLALCEDLQRRVFAPDGEVLTALRPADLQVYGEAVNKRVLSAKFNPNEVIAREMLLAFSGIPSSLLRLEEPREAARVALRNGR